MSMPQIRHNTNTIQPRILRQRRRNNLQRLRKSLEANGFRAREFTTHHPKLVRNFDFGRAASGEECAFLYKTADNALRVVEGAFCFVEDEWVGAADYDRYGGYG